jgi:hypothetical protein
MKTISIFKLLGRQGFIKNNLISKTKNHMRDNDEVTGGCVCSNTERYYSLDERSYAILYNRRRFRELKV